MRKLSPKHISLLILVFIIIAAPLFFPSSYYFRIGSLVFVNSLAVLGMVILIGFVGQISLGHAGFIGIGAYACALAPKFFGIPVLAAALLGAVLSGLVAWLVGRPILRLRGYYLSVATLGFGILVAMVLTNEAWLTGGPDGIVVLDPGVNVILKSWGLNLTNSEFWYAFSGLALVIGAAIALNLQYSATGRALRALHGSEVAARTVGVDVVHLKLPVLCTLSKSLPWLC